MRFDFCIVENPLSKGIADFLFFFSKKGKSELEEDIVEYKEYITLKEEMKKLGYSEIDIATFGSDDPSKKNEDINKDIEHILSLGIEYNKQLEEAIIKNMDSIGRTFENIMNRLDIQDKEEFLKELDEEDNGLNISSIPKPEQKSLDQKESENISIPKIGEEIELYFYLFIEYDIVSEDGVKFFFSPNFESPESTSKKNFVKITSSSFEVVNSDDSGRISLKSKKISKDFKNEVDPLFKGKLKIKQTQINEESEEPIVKETDYSYNFIEMKDKISEEGDIRIEIGNKKQFENLLVVSDAIKDEQDEIRRKKLSTRNLKERAEKIMNELENKMEKMSKKEMYEKAGELKEKRNTIQDILKKLRESNKKSISHQEKEKILSN